jgi:hypothetical protein
LMTINIPGVVVGEEVVVVLVVVEVVFVVVDVVFVVVDVLVVGGGFTPPRRALLMVASICPLA